jgi:putative transposase
MNPVRAGLVEVAEDWPWSSARAHVTAQDASKRLEMSAWAGEYDSVRWSRVLRTTIDDEAWQRRLEDATVRGLPLGSEGFVDDLERRMALRLRPNPPGRPPKPAGESTLAVRQMSLGIGN